MTRFIVISLFLLLLLSGCALRNQSISSSVGVRVIIAEVEWVKLLPIPVTDTLKDGRIAITNSCGTARVNFKTEYDSNVLATMRMNEWCEHPFSPYSEEMVVVLGEGNQLLEYHSIVFDKTIGAYIDLLSHEVADDSIFWDWLKTVGETPMFEIGYDTDNSWYQQYLENGMLSEVDGDLYLNKVVLLKDIQSHFIEK